MLRIQQQQKSTISGFIAGLYLLLLTFSPYLHEHHSANGINVSDNSSQKIEKLSQHQLSGTSDCLACHFLASNHSIHVQDFVFEVPPLLSDVSPILFYKKSWISRDISIPPLRGPPSFML